MILINIVDYFALLLINHYHNIVFPSYQKDRSNFVSMQVGNFLKWFRREPREEGGKEEGGVYGYLELGN